MIGILCLALFVYGVITWMALLGIWLVLIDLHDEVLKRGAKK